MLGNSIKSELPCTISLFAHLVANAKNQPCVIFICALLLNSTHLLYHVACHLAAFLCTSILTFTMYRVTSLLYTYVFINLYNIVSQLVVICLNSVIPALCSMLVCCYL